MAMLAVVVDRDDGTPVLGAEVVARLTELGVTSVSLVGTAGTLAWILEGWRFDPARSQHEVVRLVSPDVPAQALLPLMQALVMPSATTPSRTGTTHLQEIS